MADQDRIAPASPLPWKVAVERSGAVVDARGWGVVEAWIGVGRDAKANATHIVHCVNTYPELLAALKAIQSQCAGHSDEFSERVWQCAQAAIARAEGASHGE